MTSASVLLDGVELSVKIPGVQEKARIVPVMASVTVLFIHASAKMGGQEMDVTSLTVLEIQTVQTEVKILIMVEIWFHRFLSIYFIYEKQPLTLHL